MKDLISTTNLFPVNTVSLIAYPDSFLNKESSGGVVELRKALEHLTRQYKHAFFSRMHILPFYPGERDGGFSIIDHRKVRSSLGSFGDMLSLLRSLKLNGLTADLVLNHLDKDSPEFQDVLLKGRKSKFWSLFLKKEDVFFDIIENERIPREPTLKELNSIHRPRPTSPFTEYVVGPDKENIEFWTTFTSSQIDLNWGSDLAMKYMKESIDFLYDIGINLIRLDAAYYPAKKAGTSSFGLPQTFQILEEVTEYVHNKGMLTLLEIHAEPNELKIAAKKADYVYSFADPIVILDAVLNQRGEYIAKLLEIDLLDEKKGRNKIRVTATHDGIGPITDGRGILPDIDIENLKNLLYRSDKTGLSKEASGDSNGNVDIYQVNCTFWDALGGDSDKFLLAKAIQLFLPGLPQIYYVDLFAGGNDISFRKGEGRDINRHRFLVDDVGELAKKPVVEKLIDLMILRQNNDAFNGDFDYRLSGNSLVITWSKDNSYAELSVDFESSSFSIRSSLKM